MGSNPAPCQQPGSYKNCYYYAGCYSRSCLSSGDRIMCCEVKLLAWLLYLVLSRGWELLLLFEKGRERRPSWPGGMAYLTRGKVLQAWSYCCYALLWWPCQDITLFPLLIAGGDHSFFTPKGGDYSRRCDYSREAIIILNTAHWQSCPKYFVLSSHWIKKKIITSNILNMVFIFVSNYFLVPWLIFNVNILNVRAWIITDQFWCISLHFSFVFHPRCQFLTWQGGDKRKRKWRERGGALFKGGSFLKYFRQRVSIIIMRRQ